jgi:hypothetical protein
MPVVLCGFDAWSLTLREECRLMLMRGIFGPSRNGEMGEWRKLHNEELKDLYCLPNIVLGDKIEKYKMGRVCSTYG